MNKNELTDLFVAKINDEVMKSLTVKECGRIYSQQDIPAMTSLLKDMHKAFLSVYQTEILDSDYEWVMLPAVICAYKTDKITVGLVTLDLESSGELWAVDFLTPAGMFNPFRDDLASPFEKQMVAQWVPFDYYYTPYVPGDIHVNPSSVPESIRQMLDACRADEAETDILEEAETEDDLEL